MSEKRLRELLMPDGKPVGRPGRRRRVRVVGGGIAAAREIFDGLEDIGVVRETGDYDGVMLDVAGGTVGLRERSVSGEPTLDISVQSVPEITKIKFVE